MLTHSGVVRPRQPGAIAAVADGSSVRAACHPSPLRVPNGTVAAVTWVTAVVTVALLGPARVVTVGFLVGTAALAALLAHRRPAAAVEFAVWMWLLSPLVRRVVDFTTGYHPVSPILSAAALATVLVIPAVRGLRDTGEQRWCRPLLALVAVTTFGFAVGAFRSSLSAAGAAFVLWGLPPLFGLAVVAIGREHRELGSAVERLAVWATIGLGVYGIVQFYAITAWDAFWMNNAPIDSIGWPEPFAVRVFSTLNSPGPFAIFLTATLLYLTGSRHRLRVPAQVIGIAALGVSLVRSAWLAYLVGLVLVIVCGHARTRVAVLASMVLAAVAFTQFAGPVATVLTERVDETREGQQDDSFVARRDLHRQMLPALADRPAGSGLGATGIVTRLATDDQQPGDLAVLDSGLLDFGFSLGLPAGLTALIALAAGWVGLVHRGLRARAAPAGVYAASLSVLLQLVAGNSLVGVGGIVCFLFWGLAVRGQLDTPAHRAVVPGDQP